MTTPIKDGGPAFQVLTSQSRRLYSSHDLFHVRGDGGTKAGASNVVQDALSLRTNASKRETELQDGSVKSGACGDGGEYTNDMPWVRAEDELALNRGAVNRGFATAQQGRFNDITLPCLQYKTRDVRWRFLPLPIKHTSSMPVLRIVSASVGVFNR